MNETRGRTRVAIAAAVVAASFCLPASLAAQSGREIMDEQVRRHAVPLRTRLGVDEY